MENQLPNRGRILSRHHSWLVLAAAPIALAGQYTGSLPYQPDIRATEPPGLATGYTINQVVGADRFYNAGFIGQGVVLGNAEAGHIWGGTDVGAPPDSYAGGHSFLRGQVTRYVGSPNFTPGFPVEYDFHATMVGHAMAGAGPLSGSAIGIAPFAELWSGAIATAFDAPRLSGSFEITDKSFHKVYTDFFNGTNPGKKSADVVNSSWGGGSDTDASGILARATDGLAFKNPLTTFVVSAGNAGPGPNTVTDMAAGYNNIAVGALAGPWANHPYKEAAYFSSRGPSDFYNPVTGQTVVGARATVDIAAPGEDLRLAAYLGPTGANSDTIGGANPFLPTPPFSSGFVFTYASGTSFSSPITAGGVGLLKNVAYDLYGSNDAARDTRVVKAVLQASADHSMIGWNNGQHLVGGVITTDQALDYTYGAGGLDLNRSFETFASYDTTADVAGTMADGIISRRGWDFGSLSLADAANVFYFDKVLGGGPLSLALNWFADRTYAYSDATEEISADDLSLADLNLELWTVDGNGDLDTLYATSDSLYNNTEHLYLANLDPGHYAIRVLLDGFVYGDAGEVDYGLAWAVPEASANLGLLGLGMLALLVARRPRRSV